MTRTTFKKLYLLQLNKRTTTDCKLGLDISNHRASLGLGFFHSLFGWLSLLAAFKMWLEAGSDNPKILINGRLYNLRDLEVTGNGKRMSLRLKGNSLPRSKVNIIGVVVDYQGKLVLDTTGDYYNSMEINPSIITVEAQSVEG
jgi:hypothetical protein